jgi:hypothetical protein
MRRFGRLRIEHRSLNSLTIRFLVHSFRGKDDRMTPSTRGCWWAFSLERFLRSLRGVSFRPTRRSGHRSWRVAGRASVPGSYCPAGRIMNGWKKPAPRVRSPRASRSTRSTPAGPYRSARFSIAESSRASGPAIDKSAASAVAASPAPASPTSPHPGPNAPMASYWNGWRRSSRRSTRASCG